MPLDTPYRAINPPEFVFEYRDRVRGLRNQNWNALRKAFKSGDRKKLRRATHHYFEDKANRAAYLYEAGLRLPNTREWETEIAYFRPLEPLQHAVDWWRSPKSNGGYRLVCDLSAHMKAAHLMIADVIRAQMEVPCFVYNVKRSDYCADGTGRNALVGKLLEKLRAGYSHYRVFDVRDCFNSINPEAIERLPLPWRIYENTLKLNNLNLRHDIIREQRHSDDTTGTGIIIGAGGASGPEGLLQGSPSSNVVLAYLLQDLPQPCPQDGCILLYGDDLIALSRTATIAERVDQIVTQFFEKPNLGPLHLHRRAAGHGGHFEYLGYEFIFSEVRGDLHVNLSSRNWEKLTRVRNEVALKHWPFYGSGVDFHIRRRMMMSLSGHPALSDTKAVCDALVFGGWDHAELTARDQQTDRKR